ncbi:uncharacterized protein LOC113353909 [Papaver somniferum]|uniref:uncharacterized protein LOC113353909 n=1 Tax=Papaver somniferum TaxID=3469 RepID=UPI000E704C27|nr:uncharacterized protein LOC113353909 [Papaver somniferum]
MEAKYGSYEESYKLVPQFCKMVCDSNKDSVGTFFVGAIEGWKEGCRSVVGIDACHLNGKCGGVLMAAIGLDGQNGLVTLGIGVFPAETIENWTMFLTDLKPLLLSHENPLTFISDRQKGLLKAVHDVFLDSYHRYCWRHLYNNFKQHFKGQKLYSLLWNAAKCYKKKHFYKHMEDMKKENPAVVMYLEKAGFESWSKAFFDDTSKCEHLNNNFSESFNSMEKNLRDNPICRLGILYNQLVLSLFHKRRKESEKWNPNGLVPTAMKLIGKLCKLVGAFKVDPCVSGKLYEVTNEGSKAVFIVNLEEKQCSCLQWQLRGFVCQHDVCCLNPSRPDWTKYCSYYYSVAAYRATYAQVVFPFPPQEDWPEVLSVIFWKNMKRLNWNLLSRSGNQEGLELRGGEHGMSQKYLQRPAPQKKQSSQPSGIRKTTVASSSKAKKAPAKASITSKKKNMSQTNKLKRSKVDGAVDNFQSSDHLLHKLDSFYLKIEAMLLHHYRDTCLHLEYSQGHTFVS